MKPNKRRKHVFCVFPARYMPGTDEIPFGFMALSNEPTVCSETWAKKGRSQLGCNTRPQRWCWPSVGWCGPILRMCALRNGREALGQRVRTALGYQFSKPSDLHMKLEEQTQPLLFRLKEGWRIGITATQRSVALCPLSK